MKNQKAVMKNRLATLLPYGMTSKYALNFIPPFYNDPTCIYDPEQTMEERELICKTIRANKADAIRRMEDLDLIQPFDRKCGTKPYTKRSFYLLTKAGLSTLAGVPNQDLDMSELSSLQNSKAKISHYRSYADKALMLRADLLELASARNTDPAQTFAFEKQLKSGIRTGECTPIAEALPEMQNYAYGTAKYSPNQLYTIWRNSHIIAMFRANGFLTFLDKRQYDCGFKLDGIATETGLDAYIRKYGMTAPAVTHLALTRWYHNHPAENCYSNSAQNAMPIPFEQWSMTPTYYTTREIPGYDGLTKLEDADAQTSDFITSLNTFTGIIIGPKQNYVCYHTKPGTFTWNPRIEETAKVNIPFSIRKMNEKSAAPAASTSAENALIFCTTYHQFLNIFKRTADRHAKGRVGNYITSKPYSTMNIVPVNDSGTFLLRCLALSSPFEVANNIRNHLLHASEHFRYNESRVYPVIYNHRNVFVGHTMDVELINMAYEDYLDGQRFYISCFPEQAMWYRKLMPENELL